MKKKDYIFMRIMHVVWTPQRPDTFVCQLCISLAKYNLHCIMVIFKMPVFGPKVN